MKHQFFALTLPLVLAACSSAPTAKDSSVTPTHLLQAALSNRIQNAIPNQWFVELKADPTEDKEVSLVASQQSDFLAALNKTKIPYKQLYQYDTLFNGFALEIDDLQAKELKALPFVKDVYPVLSIDAPVMNIDNSEGEQNEMFFAKDATGVNQLHDFGITGKGVKVGIIDSGIDKNHPAFKGRIAFAQDFVGKDPDDCLGHGTHVAGIVGGSDPNYQQDGVGFSGVAPGVEFGIYRVFGCFGGAGQSTFIKAIEQAYKDGMQVINLSLGTAFQTWSQRGDALVASRLVKKGVVVVAALGNEAAYGAGSAGGVNMGENVLSVASVDNSYLRVFGLNLSDGSFHPFKGIAPVTLNTPEKGTYKLVKHPTSKADTPNDFCTEQNKDSTPNEEFKNSNHRFNPSEIVLIQRGGCPFRQKIFNAEQRGASAVIVYNDKPEETKPIAPGKEKVTIPAVFIDQATGKMLFDKLNKGIEETITFTAEAKLEVSPTANTASNFSSYGISAELELKPDIAAPGGKIWSAYPLKITPDGYAINSGTSMASPHVAGLAALLLEADPSLTAKEIRQLLINTASLSPRRDANNTLTNDINYVELMGAGVTNITNAYAARIIDKVQVDPPKLELLDSALFPTRVETITLKNKGNKPLTYLLKHVPALSVTGTTYKPQPDRSFATVLYNGKDISKEGVRIVVEPESETEVTVSISAPTSAPEFSRYGGFIQFKSSTAADLVVPYSGLKGNKFNLPSFGTIYSKGRAIQTPYLYHNVDELIYPRGTTVMPEFSFGLKRNKSGNTTSDSPFIYVNFAQPIRNYKLEVIDENNKAYLIEEDNYSMRHCTNDFSKRTDQCNIFYSLIWTGQINKKPALDGIYQIRLTALKPLGTPGIEGHEDIYLSPKFTIKRATPLPTPTKP